MINRKLHISALMETDSYSYTWSPFKIHTVSEQLSAISWREQVSSTFYYIMMMSALHQTNMLSWVFIVLPH